MIYTKTELGQSALLSRSLVFTPRQRSAFIMFDGKRSTKDVLKATAGLGITDEDVIHMVEQGLLVAIADTLTSPALASVAATSDTAPVPLQEASDTETTRQNAQANYSKAYPIATRLTASLGLRGFRLNLAVEAAGDLAKLRNLAPKIRDAVGAEKFKELNSALYD